MGGRPRASLPRKRACSAPTTYTVHPNPKDASNIPPVIHTAPIPTGDKIFDSLSNCISPRIGMCRRQPSCDEGGLSSVLRAPIPLIFQPAGPYTYWTTWL